MAQRSRRGFRGRFGLAGDPRAAIALAIILVLASVFGFSRFHEAVGVRLLARGASAATMDDPQAGGSASDGDAASDGEGGDSPDSTVDGNDGAYLLIVHVDGAVASPGVYRIRATDARVIDAVEAAGGLLEDARTDSVNLAAILQDGQKIHIPSNAEYEQAAASSGVSTASSSGAAIALVDINNARADELMTLPGIGEVTALSIIEDREREGPFTCIEDLMRVSGIGEKKYERLKDRIRV